MSLPSVYQAYGPTDLMDVTCPSTTICLAIGDQPPPPRQPMINDGIYRSSMYSLLYRSTDGGVTWTPVPVPGGTLDPSYNWEVASVAVSCGSPTFCVLEYVSIDADSPSDVFEVSTDGGLTWTAAQSGFESLNDPTGLSHLTCVGRGTCVGIIGGQIASTTDEGTTWVTHMGRGDVKGLSCLSPALCYVVQSETIQDAPAVVVSRTTNRGGTLAPVLRLYGAGLGPTAISCASALACAVATSGVIYPSLRQIAFTGNGGHTWRTQYGPLVSPQQLEGIQCTATQDCTILATSTESRASLVSYATTDGGATWDLATIGHLGFSGAIPSLWCGASLCLAALGTRSVFGIDPTHPSATAWTASPVGVGARMLKGVACEASGHCLAVGNGVRATSSDDGRTWTAAADAALSGDSITSLTCPLPTTCFATGFTGSAAAPSGLILVTTDLGASWSTGTVPWEVGGVSNVQCASADTCLAQPNFVGGLTNVPTFLLRSTDGGLDWSLLQLAPASAHLSLSGVACPASTRCLTVGADSGGAVVETSADGGATWTSIDLTTGGFSETAFHGIACASALDCETAAPSSDDSQVFAWGTTDGGATWSQLGQMLAVPQAGYWYAGPTMGACSSGTCAGLSHNEVGPERPVAYDTVAASSDGGADWDTFDPAGSVQCVTVAPDGTVIALVTNAENGPMLVAGNL